MKRIKIIIISITIILCSLNNFGQQEGSEYNQIEMNNLINLSQQFHLLEIQDSIKTDSLANVLFLPKIIYNQDSTISILITFTDGKPIYYSTCNLVAAKTISTDKVWPGGSTGYSKTGSGITIGLWEAGNIKLTHQELIGRITIGDPNDRNNNSISYYEAHNNIINKSHATHVAGTLIASGIVSEAKGMAYESNLWWCDWFNDYSEMLTAASQNIRISNHSYGGIIGWHGKIFYDNQNQFGAYNFTSNRIDNVVNHAPYHIICWAAGNDRVDNVEISHYHSDEMNDPNPPLHDNSVCQHLSDANFRNLGGYGTILPEASAKNIISVGAVWDIPNGWNNMNDVRISDFSNFGKSLDGRVKPDIVACGTEQNYGTRGLFSCIWDNTRNDMYSYKEGTSMATPTVAGSIALLLQEELDLYLTKRMLSSTIKGLIIHTANESGNQGPDYQFGWGLMNTAEAIKLMRLDYQHKPCSYIREYTLNNGSTIEFYVKAIGGNIPLKATICWIDPAGQGSGKDLINDLDLRITKIDNNNTIYYPWILNPSSPSTAATTGDNCLDNVEQVLISNPTQGGLYKLVISHKGTLQNSSPQKVSLIYTGFNTQEYDIHIPENSTPLTINNNFIQIKFANNTIFLADNAPLTISSPANVDYIAGQNIKMYPGFKAEYGSQFKAEICDCSEDVFSKMNTNNFVVKDNPKTDIYLNITPNPSSENIKLQYSLPIDGIITIKLINYLGEEISILANNKYQVSGNHSLYYDVSTLPSGIYFISIANSANVKLNKFLVFR